MAGETVLVTGGSGFIGGWCIIRLIQAGYVVRTTVRSLSREREVRGWLSQEADLADRLGFFPAELMSDAGWAEALAGCDYVLHVASPIPPALPRNEDELIRPAREGTLRVLKAARKAGVKRVVVTSSTAAVTYGADRTRTAPFTESDWTNPAHPDTSAYIRSKTLAERAAWDYMRDSQGSMTMATVNPGAVLGPVLGKDYSASVQIVQKLLEGSLPGCPRFGFPLVDVRDIADLHLLAMTSPAAAGERFLGAGPFFWMQDVARVLKERLGPAARKVPLNTIPDMMVRLSSLFDPAVRAVAFELGRARPVSNEKAKRVLGWAPRSNEEAIVACAESLIRYGAIKGLSAAA